ncbi:MAG TPA: basic amino acid ABC transporter substrate-binding protein, partial [Anaerovibrio sp.]|nr:basic amino acid ABC transporter substrate-binding protein [Anaerovibrio sp.]
MKKVLLILSALVFAIVALAGCGADNKQASND